MKGKEAFALFVVVILVVAALSVGVLVKNNDKGEDSNPNGILGKYGIVTDNLCTYGSEPVSSFNPGTGEYGKFSYYNWGFSAGRAFGEISIDSYNNGIVKVTCYRIVSSHEVKIGEATGYYDPETGAFGFANGNEITPISSDESKKDVYAYSVYNGHIKNDTMSLQGFMISKGYYTEENFIPPVAYTYNLLFVKEKGTVKYPAEFEQVLFASKEYKFKLASAYSSFIDGEGTPASQKLNTDLAFNIAFPIGSFYKGVYALSITKTDAETGNEIQYPGTAVTVYQDKERTYLRCLWTDVPTVSSREKIPDGTPFNIHLAWICVEGDSMYVIDKIAVGADKDTRGQGSDLYILTNESPKSYKTYDLAGKTMEMSMSAYFAKGNVSVDSKYAAEFFPQLKNTFTTPLMLDGGWSFIDVWPDTDCISCRISFMHDGVKYSGDLVGHIGSDGNIIMFGFCFGENSDVAIVHGEMKQV